VGIIVHNVCVCVCVCVCMSSVKDGARGKGSTEWSWGVVHDKDL
jgi:hypothetical protein